MNIYYRLIGIQLVLITQIVFAQHQNDNWYMGGGAGMSFQNGTMQIIPVGTTNAQSYLYSASSYSDPVTGDLLFYTDGSTIYSKDHQVMQNGGSMNVLSIVSRSLIIPYPGDSTRFYVFTFEFDGRDPLNIVGMINYSILDISKNNGLGEVIQKNTLLGDRFTCGFTSVRQAFNEGWWLVTHLMNSDTFCCYRIGTNGIETNPVISSFGKMSSAKSIRRSNMISSTDGNWIFYTDGSQYIHYPPGLYRINRVCGSLFLHTEFTPYREPGYDNDTADAVDAAFSKSGELLYIAWEVGTSYIESILSQADLTQNDPGASQFKLGSNIGTFRDMQLAPDGKIYMTEYSNLSGSGSKISVINKPELRGTACDIKDRCYDLNPDGVRDKYVPFLPSLVTNWIEVDSEYQTPGIVRRDTCFSDSTVFSIDIKLDADSMVWDLGDGTVEHGPEIAHEYADTGTYLIVLKWYLCSYVREIKDSVTITRIQIDLGNDTDFCKGQSFTIAVNDSMDHYKWSTGDTTQKIEITQPGTYTVEVNKRGCGATDSIELQNYPGIWVQLGDEYFICDDLDELVRLDAGEGFQKYLWTPTGDTTQWIQVMDLGDYFVVVKDFNGCNGDGATQVKRRCPTQIYFPNVFTPNGDGLNDDYRPKGANVISFLLKIYNRWGQLVFESDDINKTWNGKVNGEPAPTDVYFYTSTYSGLFNHRIAHADETGSFSLLR